MPNKTLINSRVKAFKQQQGLCIYCESHMWDRDPQKFSEQNHINPKAIRYFQCTAEHLHARQDGGGDHRSNIVAACAFCNHKRHARKKPLEPLAFKNLVTKRRLQGKWNTSFYKH